MNEQEERDARYAVKEYIGYAIRKSVWLSRALIDLLEATDRGDNWEGISLALNGVSSSLSDIDREFENAIRIADENCPPPEHPTSDEIIAMGKKALTKPKKPRAKKIPKKVLGIVAHALVEDF